MRNTQHERVLGPDFPKFENEFASSNVSLGEVEHARNEKRNTKHVTRNT